MFLFQMNKYIFREGSRCCRIEFNLTHHIARKTFASTVLLYNDVPMEIVSELLGHSSMKITQDSYGKILRVTAIAIADELCAAAEITMGKASKIPVVIIRNYKLDSVSSNAKNLIRPKVEDLFS